MPALNLDVALIHVDRADERGVCQIKGPDLYMDDWYARAADKTFVTCDELVDTEFFHQGDEARYVHWERSMTTGVRGTEAGKGGCGPVSTARTLRESLGFWLAITTAIAPRKAPVKEWVTTGYAPGLSAIRSKVAALPGPTT